VQFTKYLEYLETLATETGKRPLCEAAADAVMASDVGLESTLKDYMVKVGTEFRRTVIAMGKDITEYAVNKAFKNNSDYVFRAFEAGVDPKTVAAKLYGDVLTVPPKSSYVAPVHYVQSGDDSVGTKQYPMVAESVGSSISDYVKKHAIALAIGAALGTGAMVGVPKAVDAAGDLGAKATEAVQKSRKDAETIDRVARWNSTGDRIGELKDWKYVDHKDKPGVYGNHLNGVPLAEIEQEANPMTKKALKVGWWVSPDGHEVFSTVTGKYFRTEKDFNDPSFTRADLGEPAGVGGHYVMPSSLCFPWDEDAYYGKAN
jgi:hypothetical protein